MAQYGRGRGTTQTRSSGGGEHRMSAAASALMARPASPGKRMVTRSQTKGIAPIEQLQLLNEPSQDSSFHSITAKRRYRPRGFLSANVSTDESSSEVKRMRNEAPAVGGMLRCVCDGFLTSPQEVLLQCRVCANYCHPACVGVDHLEVRLRLREGNFVCPRCEPSVRPALSHRREEGAAASVSSATTSGMLLGAGTHALPSFQSYTPETIAALSTPAPRQSTLRLQEVPDVFPANVEVLRRAMDLLRFMLTKLLPYTILDLPHTVITEMQVAEALRCCERAVRDATLSASYPLYCIREVRAALHPYVQGALLQGPNTANQPQICSLICSNGMDLYGNLKRTITQLKSALQRGHTSIQSLCEQFELEDGTASSNMSAAEFVDACLGINDVSEFVHITLSATHEDFQGQQLATLLFTLELLRWSIRGRRKAFLNMAIEKKLVPAPESRRPPGRKAASTSASSSTSSTSGSSATAAVPTRVEYITPVASRRLYRRLGFLDVYPRTDPATGKPTWTAKEADMGRVMIQFDFNTAALRVAAILEERFIARGVKFPSHLSLIRGVPGSPSMAPLFGSSHRLTPDSSPQSRPSSSTASTPSANRVHIHFVDEEEKKLSVRSSPSRAEVSPRLSTSPRGAPSATSTRLSTVGAPSLLSTISRSLGFGASEV